MDARTLIDSARRRESTYRLRLRGDLVAEHERLERALIEATSGATTADNVSVDAIDIAAQIRQVEADIAASTATLTLRALPRHEWETLLASHPARDGVEEEFNDSTFPTALVAASLSDPVMDEGEVEELFDVVNAAERLALFGAAWAVNTEATAVPFSARASVVIGWRDQSSTPRGLGESPEASS